MTRKGKIARLPRNIRETLNSRLENGEPGADLVLWLNTQPEVRAILAADFQGRAITEQNLSDWRQGAYLDWLRKQETSERVSTLLEFCDDLDNATDVQTIPDRLATVLAAELAAETQKILEKESDPSKRLRQISDALMHLHKIRYANLTSGRLDLEMERMEIERAERKRAETKKLIEDAAYEAKRPIFEALRRPAMVAAFGGGEAAGKMVDFLNEIDEEAGQAKLEASGHKTSPSNQPKVELDPAKSQ